MHLLRRTSSVQRIRALWIDDDGLSEIGKRAVVLGGCEVRAAALHVAVHILRREIDVVGEIADGEVASLLPHVDEPTVVKRFRTRHVGFDRGVVVLQRPVVHPFVHVREAAIVQCPGIRGIRAKR